MGLAYTLPFLVYYLGTVLAAQFPQYYPVSYTLAVVATAVCAVWSYRGYRPFSVHFRILDAIAGGAIGLVVWLVLCHLRLEDRIASYLPALLQPGERLAYQPFEELKSASLVVLYGFIAVRMLGLAVLTPIVEEIFWRGFLARYLVDEEWQKVALGKFTTTSFLLLVLLFTLAHPEWIAAAVYCAMINAYLIWTRDLWKCIVFHGTTNLLLGIYVLQSGRYELW